MLNQITKNAYSVTWQHSENVYCSNVAIAESEEAVKAYYMKKSNNVTVKEASDSEIREAERKGVYE